MTIILNILMTIFVSSAKEIRVAVIDGGFDPFISSKVKTCEKSEPKVFGTTDDPLYVKHGTNVAGLIQKYAGVKKEYCFILVVGLITKYSLIDSLQYAIDQKADIINISGGGYGWDRREFMNIMYALEKGITIFASVGNEGKNLNARCSYYPICYDPRIKAVGNKEEYANKLDRAIISDKDGAGEKVLGVELHGTSQSTAIETGRYISNL